MRGGRHLREPGATPVIAPVEYVSKHVQLASAATAFTRSGQYRTTCTNNVAQGHTKGIDMAELLQASQTGDWDAKL